MRLFLSSQNLGNYPEVFLDLMGNNKLLAFVENAKDYGSPDERAQKVKEHKEQFESQGFTSLEIDLRDFFGKPNELEKRLAPCGGIWIGGGNTFILRRAFAYSGLDKILQKLVTNNTMVYGGSSAGSVIATPSLQGTEHGDNPDIVPAGYKPEIIWEGLGFVPFYITPHYKSDWFGAESSAMKDYFEKKELPYYALQDGQVVLVNDKKVELLT